ncbi:MAG TPA: crosslink repair DNA glycosylase YcaQ family protein, partial [Phototrophicaceae bacterium]|nr:crosslink repair DNA glycosylase YcaQ family protein [Phototrophicaceae bacterium]
MVDRILTLRELNRATLARQFLLERASITIPAAIERLVGLQAQQAQAPYIGLWTRLTNFERDVLAALIDNHTVIKATTMRATLHLMTAADYRLLRTTIQRVLDQAFEAISKGRDASLDFDAILTMGRDYLAETPRTFAEISDHFTKLL